eukprot:TRINITY_DN11138_c0_g1_i2.p1 TRINITY_DN11138_c0_g1~~TRINITY_DN11138_c0_g1_i2.p1  ORF type:complete len:138 (+),score=17.26 TRINITY_DN11138_c0_g1_i2:65-478(+)
MSGNEAAPRPGNEGLHPKDGVRPKLDPIKSVVTPDNLSNAAENSPNLSIPIELDEMRASGRATPRRSILKKSRFAEPKKNGVPGPKSPTSPNGGPGSRSGRVSISENLTVHKVDNWKKYNINDEEEKPTTSCRCELF